MTEEREKRSLILKPVKQAEETRRRQRNKEKEENKEGKVCLMGCHLVVNSSGDTIEDKPH